MTEPEPPQLHFTRDHLMAMTQLLTMLSQRLAEQRERRGRAAYTEVTALWMTVFLRDLLLWVIPGHCV